MKKLAVLAVNPVNGYGLFNYLETFYENKVDYRVFAVADSVHISTNSRISLTANDVIANLKGKSDEFDGLVFACGDAVPQFGQHASEQPNVDLMDVIREFAGKKKLMIGHCGAALLFDMAGVADGVKVSVHPLAKPAVQKAIANDESYTVDRNFYTAKEEHHLAELMPALLKALK